MTVTRCRIVYYRFGTSQCPHIASQPGCSPPAILREGSQHNNNSMREGDVKRELDEGSRSGLR